MKILLLDIEISPIISHVWGLWDNNVALNQIEKDWHLLSWAAKFLGKREVFYADQSKEKDISNDKKILQKLWLLIDQSDIIIGQNSKKFDTKKLNARFLMHGMQPPTPYKQIDTLELAKKYFAFTSNKLEYMSDKLCTKYKKLKHKKFPGHEMWVECLKGNQEAWAEMRKYNIHDVLALEELYLKLQPWDTSVNFNHYSEELITRCNCGSYEFRRKGFFISPSGGKFQRYKCKKCGAPARDKVNVLDKEKKMALKTLNFKGEK